MAFKISDEHVDQFFRDGYVIFRGLIPATLLKELRVMADAGRSVARELGGPQSQRLQPIVEHLDCKAYFEFVDLPELVDAIHTIYGDGFVYGRSPDDPSSSRAGVLFEPRDQPYSTQWHRDWRDNIPGLEIGIWEQKQTDLRYFNQVNCALYEDGCTWVVPGSHLRKDVSAEVARFPMRPIPGPALEGLDDSAAELACLAYCRSMPGAVQACLNAGDFMLYRNSLWHLGNYTPYKRRSTIHDGVWTPEFYEWFSNWPKHAGTKATMLNPHVGRPEYEAWRALQPVES